MTPPIPRSVTERLLIGLGFVLHVIFCFHEIARPFLQGHLGWAASMRATIARNYVELGWLQTGLLPYKAAYPLTEPGGPIHWNHPPTINILTALSWEIFGTSEWAAQLVTVMMAIACYPLVYVLGRRVSPIAGVAAAWLWVWSPLQLEYGKLLNYEVPIIMCALAGLVAFARRTPRADVVAVACMVAAVLVDWGGCFIAAAMGIPLMLERRFRAFAALGGATGLTAIGLFVWLNGVASGGLTQLGARRAAGNTFAQLVEVTAQRFGDFFGPAVLALAVVGVVAAARSRRLDATVITFGVGTTLYFAVFKNAAVVHVFYILLFLPAVVVAAAVGVDAVARWVSALHPSATATAPWLAGALVAGAVASTWPSAQALHRRSFSMPDRASRMPWDARFNEYLVAKWLHENSAPADLIATHTSVTLTPQARYYLHRRVRARVAALKSPGARFLVFADRKLTRKQRLELDAKHHTIRMVGYFIVDTQNAQVPDRIVEYSAQPADWVHLWLVSRLFPPYELREKSLAAPSKLQ